MTNTNDNQDKQAEQDKPAEQVEQDKKTEQGEQDKQAEQDEQDKQAEPAEQNKPAEQAEQDKQAKQSDDGKNWYVVQTYSTFEKRVQQSIKDRAEREGLSDLIGEVLIPVEEVVEMRAGQKRTSERKFFPGYVLVNMEINDETWHMINSLPKVSGFIGGKRGDPVPLSDKEADSILQRMTDSLDAPKPKFTFAPGEVVRVIDGPFADFTGMVEDVNFEKSRLHVSVSIFGRSTPVELGFDQVEKG